MTSLSEEVGDGAGRGGIPGETARPQYEQRLSPHTKLCVALQRARLRLLGILRDHEFQPGKEPEAST